MKNEDCGHIKSTSLPAAEHVAGIVEPNRCGLQLTALK